MIVEISENMNARSKMSHRSMKMPYLIEWKQQDWKLIRCKGWKRRNIRNSGFQIWAIGSMMMP
jgi:hypothetical protein